MEFGYVKDKIEIVNERISRLYKIFNFGLGVISYYVCYKL